MAEQKRNVTELFDMKAHLAEIKKTLPKDWDEVLTETAGFVPLEVRFKRMQEAGIAAQFHEGDFDSSDWNDIYLEHPEFDINEDDELEDVIQKQQMRQAYIEQLRAKKQSELVNEATEQKAAQSNPDSSAVQNESLPKSE